MGNTFLVWAKKAMERWYLLITEKFLFWTSWGWEIRSFFEPKSWWKDDIYWLLKSSYFELFRDGKYVPCLTQKVDGKVVFTDHWKVLVLRFLEMRNTLTFERKSWWKDDIYWLLKSSCVEVFGDWKYRLFWAKMLLEKWYLLINEKLFSWTFRRWEIRSILSQKVDGKMIFTGYWKCLLFNISVMGNAVFFKSKS